MNRRRFLKTMAAGVATAITATFLPETVKEKTATEVMNGNTHTIRELIDAGVFDVDDHDAHKRRHIAWVKQLGRELQEVHKATYGHELPAVTSIRFKA